MRERQQLFGERRDEQLRMRKDRLLQTRRRPRTACRRTACPRRQSACSPSSRSPAPHRVVVLEREADRIHQLDDSPRRRIRPMLGQPLAHGRGCCAASSCPSSAGTFGGGGGGGTPSRLSSIHLPRMTGDVRVGYDVTIRMLPWRRSPPRTPSSGRTRRGGSGCRRRSGCRNASQAARSRTCSSRAASRARSGSRG